MVWYRRVHRYGVSVWVVTQHTSTLCARGYRLRCRNLRVTCALAYNLAGASHKRKLDLFLDPSPFFRQDGSRRNGGFFFFFHLSSNS